MKWIEYDYLCNENKGITVHKKVEYNDANLAIAKVEAVNGYQVVTDSDDVALDPIPESLGGTGKTSFAEAMKACFENGYLVLSSKQFGKEFPTDAPNGTIFFKEVDS